MASSQHDQFANRHPPRPQLQSQHSTSVPSTPYQLPIDLRRTTRSPSPHRSLANQSPQSVASEARRHVAPQRLPVVCKYEVGSEKPRRRMPYIDAARERLDPPREPPKKTLDPEQEKKLEGDMRTLYDRLQDRKEGQRAELVQKLGRIMREEWPDGNIQVAVFGSSGNLLSSSDSDVDICVTTSLKDLESMHSLAMLLDSHGMKSVLCRAAAKVPIVKCWDPELQLACDINVNNTLALENTRMIKTYVQMDQRVRILAKVVKHWTKQRILNDAAYGGTISSYTWICMIINFLQRRSPPILPSLQKIPNIVRSTVNGQPSRFADDLEALKGYGDYNDDSYATLLFDFFKHYGYEFDFAPNVISVREGRDYTRKEKGWTDKHMPEAHCRLAVEEPFNTGRNLGNSADEYSWHGIHLEIRRAFDLLKENKSLDEVCQQYEFPPETSMKSDFVIPSSNKPKPVLTRSASQSGRSNDSGGSGRRKNGPRNNSAQRASNRRASSGASFNAPRGFVHSPVLNGLPDHFPKQNANLHEQLFQQWQYLQAQQDALRNQLLAQQASQQAQAHAQARAGDLAGINPPHQRPQFLPGGLPNGQQVAPAPQTAPLQSGFINYPYTPRFHPPSPMQQQQAQRSREGTITNPSSPSMAAAMPALRRQIHRATLPDGSNGSIRSQSQPGRSFPNQGFLQIAPFDLSTMPNGLQNLRMAQPLGAMPNGHMQFANMPTMRHATQMPTTETAVPKEYVGFYIGQSPQLGLQYANVGHMQVPNMPALQNPPQKQRRVTPDLMPPPPPKDRHSSRSPSPLSHLRSYSTTGDLRAANGQGAAAARSQLSFGSAAPVLVSTPVRSPVGDGGPIIANGSNPPVLPRPAQRPNGLVNGDAPVPGSRTEQPRAQTLPLRVMDEAATESTGSEKPLASPHVAPSPRIRTSPQLQLVPNGTAHHSNGINEQYPELLPVSAQPLLSPVAELRTPSPTHQRLFEPHSSPSRVRTNGISPIVPLTNGKGYAQRTENCAPTAKSPITNGVKAKSPTTATIDKRKPLPNSMAPPPPPTPLDEPHEPAQDKNPWQPVTSRKGHKKSKSAANAGSPREGMPSDISERKGG
ncbi:hypothetical protein B0A48_01850 [Cryoendolithus antarcticus]|uniref:polynucleotide adenylyltransferase n=1 Tax=Cryoendolithus antarcticus TaxID=1507870 RepID=A0A1V8TQT3_9PEZI|nr:hypothetical protein B0A48_01850 [Cryoendolithus antarcticus]